MVTKVLHGACDRHLGPVPAEKALIWLNRCVEGLLFVDLPSSFPFHLCLKVWVVQVEDASPCLLSIPIIHSLSIYRATPSVICFTHIGTLQEILEKWLLVVVTLRVMAGHILKHLLMLM